MVAGQLPEAALKGKFYGEGSMEPPYHLTYWGPQPAYGAAFPSKVANFAGSVCIPGAKAKGSAVLIAVVPSLCCVITTQACNVRACEAQARRVVTLVIEAALHKLSIR